MFADGGREVYRAFATPAVFDPITVFNRANPTELVYAWEPRMFASRAFPDNDWSGNRGCDRESYAQPGYWYNGGGGEDYYTDAMGSPRDRNDPAALRQVISPSNSVRRTGHPRRPGRVQDPSQLLRRDREAGPEELVAGRPRR